MARLPLRLRDSRFRREAPTGVNYLSLPWECMGSGGLHGLQTRWGASFDVLGGFDSLTLPPHS